MPASILKRLEKKTDLGASPFCHEDGIFRELFREDRAAENSRQGRFPNPAGPHLLHFSPRETGVSEGEMRQFGSTRESLAGSPIYGLVAMARAGILLLSNQTARF